MADQAAKAKRQKAERHRDKGVVDELADGIVDSLMTEVKPPALESIDQQRQRRKLEVMHELEDFRASFSRGYAVILAELALKRAQGGEPQVWQTKPSEESEQS